MFGLGFTRYLGAAVCKLGTVAAVSQDLPAYCSLLGISAISY